MTSATHSLLAQANALTVATDGEDWPAATKLLGQINQALRQNADFDQKTLETVLTAIEHAMKDTERRRDEIALLLKALGGSGIKPAADNTSRT